MSLVISSVFTYDTDAGNYIQAVEAADEAASPGIGPLEPATRKAINDFVIGCKQGGIWDAIKASCILAGAKTLAGALVPLVGAAPTNNGPFVAGDYNRKTGLVGDGSTKYLNSNRNDTSDPQDNHHLSVYVSTLGTGPAVASATVEVSGSSNIGITSTRSRNATVNAYSLQTGFNGISRSSSASYLRRSLGSTASVTQASEAVTSQTMLILRGSSFYGSHRIPFYSIGESLDLAKLDGRVTDLINKFSEVIP